MLSLLSVQYSFYSFLHSIEPILFISLIISILDLFANLMVSLITLIFCKLTNFIKDCSAKSI